MQLFGGGGRLYRDKGLIYFSGGYFLAYIVR
jgi:hypothetical protein